MTIDVSASQVKAFRRCARYWAFQKIDGERTPDTEATAYGKRVHRLLEDWSNHGTPVDPSTPEGRSAMVLLRYLPSAQRDDISNEAYFEFMGPRTGAKYRGLIDQAHLHEGRPVIRDYKTTGDLRYALSEDDLLQDEQAIIYSYFALAKAFPDQSAIDLNWLYVERVTEKSDRNPRTKDVRVEVDRKTLDAMDMGGIEDTVTEMIEGKAQWSKALDAPPNYNACGDYGGCPFVGLCGVTDRDRLGAIMANNKLLSDLKANAEKEGDNINPPKQEAKQEPREEKPKKAKGGILPKIKGKKSEKQEAQPGPQKQSKARADVLPLSQGTAKDPLYGQVVTAAVRGFTQHKSIYAAAEIAGAADEIARHILNHRDK